VLIFDFRQSLKHIIGIGTKGITVPLWPNRSCSKWTHHRSIIVRGPYCPSVRSFIRRYIYLGSLETSPTALPYTRPDPRTNLNVSTRWASHWGRNYPRRLPRFTSWRLHYCRRNWDGICTYTESKTCCCKHFNHENTRPIPREVRKPTKAYKTT